MLLSDSGYSGSADSLRPEARRCCCYFYCSYWATHRLVADAVASECTELIAISCLLSYQEPLLIATELSAED